MKIVAMRGRPDSTGINSQRFEFRKDDCTNTITSVQKDNLVIEKRILRPERTDYGKKVRKQYESGNINEKRKNMTSLKPRTDDISNTLTTVQKDNLLLESKVINIGNVNPSGRGINGNAVASEGLCPTLTTNKGEGQKISESSITEKFRVRKLTQKECWRLMGFSDEDFERARDAMNKNIYNGKDRSGSQLYKMAGNSIVVDVLEHIMNELHNAMPYLFEEIKLGSFFSGIGAFEKALSRLKPEYKNKSDEPFGSEELRQLGHINESNATANRIYDSNIACTLKAGAGGGGAKTGWYRVKEASRSVICKEQSAQQPQQQI